MSGWRLKNLILGGMFLFWGIARLVQSPSEIRWTVPVIVSSLLQLTVGYLFAIRSEAKKEGDRTDLAITGGSLMAGAYLFSLAPTDNRAWPWSSLALITIGSAITIFALMQLGRSFAIFPARRTLVTRGPYSIVRHPAYAGELTVIFGVAIASDTALAGYLVSATFVLVAWRITREEHLLSADTDHRSYQHKVRYKLVPGVW